MFNAEVLNRIEQCRKGIAQSLQNLKENFASNATFQNSTFQELSTRLDKIEGKLDKLDATLQTFKGYSDNQTNGKQQSSNSNPTVNTSRPAGQPLAQNPQSPPQQRPQPQLEYFSKCVSGGFQSFAQVIGTNAEANPLSIYVLEIMGDNAKFYPIASRSTSLIFSKETQLKPVCEIEENAGGQHIEVVEKGDLKRNGNDWELTKKCRIKII
jgi:hypothetical protein